MWNDKPVIRKDRALYLILPNKAINCWKPSVPYQFSTKSDVLHHNCFFYENPESTLYFARRTNFQLPCFCRRLVVTSCLDAVRFSTTSQSFSFHTPCFEQMTAFSQDLSFVQQHKHPSRSELGKIQFEYFCEGKTAKFIHCQKDQLTELHRKLSLTSQSSLVVLSDSSSLHIPEQSTADYKVTMQSFAVLSCAKNQFEQGRFLATINTKTILLSAFLFPTDNSTSDNMTR